MFILNVISWNDQFDLSMCGLEPYIREEILEGGTRQRVIDKDKDQ